jgi:hypothetical protein
LKRIKQILQGLHEFFLSPSVFSFLLASSPFFSTPHDPASQGSSSSKKMTKGISTRRWTRFYLRGKWYLTFPEALPPYTSWRQEEQQHRLLPFNGGEAQGQRTGGRRRGGIGEKGSGESLYRYFFF